MVEKLISLLKAIIISAGAYGFMILVHYFVNNMAYVLLLLDNDYQEAMAAYDMLVAERYIVASVLLVLGYFLFFKAAGQPFNKLYRLRTMDFELVVMSFFIGVIANVMTVSLAEIIPIPQAWIDANAESVNSISGSLVITPLLVILVFAPVAEEFLFRGIIYGELRKAIGMIPAAICVSVLFGAFHGNILQAIYCGLISLLMIYIYERSGSLFGPIILHMGFNGSTLLTGNLYKSFSYVQLAVIAGAAVAAMMLIFWFRSKSLRRLEE